MTDTVSELRSWLNARIARDDALATRNTARGLYGEAADGHARVQAFRDVLDHLNQLEDVTTAALPQQLPAFVRAQDFAEQRGVNVKTITRACIDGRITATKHGRAWLIPRSELDRSTEVGDW